MWAYSAEKLQPSDNLWLYNWRTQMRCIYCLRGRTSVTNSREARGSLATWRRRHCSHCGKTFTTTETAQGSNLFVVKRTGRRQRFVYEKLLASLLAAIGARKNRDSGDDAILARDLAARVVAQMIASLPENRSVPTSAIIGYAHAALAEADQAYADYYIYYSPYRRQVGTKLGLAREAGTRRR